MIVIVYICANTCDNDDDDDDDDNDDDDDEDEEEEEDAKLEFFPGQVILKNRLL